MKTLASLLLLTLSLPAAARIGETGEQLTARYGKAWHVKGADLDMMIFCHDGLYISTTLWRGTCHSIKFTTEGQALILLTKDQEPLPAIDRKELTEWQAQDLMESCRAGSLWFMAGYGDDAFFTEDDRQEAMIRRNELEIRTPAWRKYLEARSEAALDPHIVHEKASMPRINRTIYFGVFMPEDSANP